MVTLEDIHRKYETAILRCQELHASKVKGTAGAVRHTKGRMVEDITKDLVQIAWAKVSSDEARLKIDKKKIPIRTNGVIYKLSQDLHVFIDDVFRIGIECKSYTEVAMYKRVLVDAKLLKKERPSISAFFIVQLENFLGGDYGVKIEAKGSDSVITLNRICPQVNIKVITLLDGDRNIKKPLHIPQYSKQLTDERLEYAIRKFKEAMAPYGYAKSV